MVNLHGSVFAMGGLDETNREHQDSIEELVTVDDADNGTKVEWRVREEKLPDKRSEFAAVMY